MTFHRINPDILKRYLDGQATPEEAEMVEKWYSDLNPDRDQHVFDQPRHLLRVREAIRSNGTGANGKKSRSVFSFPAFSRVVAAAMVLLVCALGGYLYTSQSSDPVTVVAEPLTTLVNNGKQIQRQQLPDGSTIWLQPGACLTYDAHLFKASGRDVTLEGDAFFDVARDESRPFTVITKDLKIQVLGTSFHVKAATGEPRQEVTVISGKVKVSSARQAGNVKEVALLPAQKAVLEVATGELVPDVATPENSPLKTWQPASLEFSDIRLVDAARRLEEKFSVSIRLDNHKMDNCLMTAAFEDLQLTEILETISLMLDLTYELDGDTILLRGSGC